MPVAWRLVRERHADTAFSGQGAMLFGGRWNSPGIRVVYASQSLALAALETLVHLNPFQPLRYVCFQIDFPAGLVERILLEDLPEGWQASPPGAQSQSIGDRWARRGTSPVLALPSVIVPGETNYLLNPLHPEFADLQIAGPQPFSFDPRLLKKE